MRLRIATCSARDSLARSLHTSRATQACPPHVGNELATPNPPPGQAKLFPDALEIALSAPQVLLIAQRIAPRGEDELRKWRALLLGDKEGVLARAAIDARHKHKLYTSQADSELAPTPAIQSRAAALRTSINSIRTGKTKK